MNIKISLIIIILIISFNTLQAQLKLNIDTMYLSNLRPIIDTNLNDEVFYWIEYEANGPNVYLICTLINNGEKSEYFSINNNIFSFSFNYENEYYLIESTPFGPFPQEGVELAPNEHLRVFIAEDIFIGTKLWNERKTNYTEELLKILPTLRFHFKDIIVPKPPFNVVLEN